MIENLLTPGGVPYSVLRPANAPYPNYRPLLLLFGGPASISLGDPTTFEIGRLLQTTDSPWVIASMDPPGDGWRGSAGQWTFLRDEWRAGRAVYAPFAEDVRAVIADLVARAYVVDNRQRQAVCGISRFGDLANQLVQRGIVDTAVDFSPVTDWHLMTEFLPEDPILEPTFPASFNGKNLYLAIGPADTRVSTSAAVSFAGSVAAAHVAAGLAGVPNVTVKISPASGHNLPACAPRDAANWLCDQAGGQTHPPA